MHSPTSTSSDTVDWEDGFVETNGIRLHYYRTGDTENPTLVLAHGLYDDGRCFSPTAAAFADDYDVIAIDARGHGLSDAPGTGYGTDNRVADLVGLLDKLAVDAPLLWGHSMGGNTAACLAASIPERPRALILEDPAGMLPGVHERIPERHIAEVKPMVESWQTQPASVLKDSFEHEAWTEYLFDARRRVRPEITAIFEEGYLRPSETFPEIVCPTLVLRADADESQRSFDRKRVSLLDDGRLEHITNAGHCIRRDEFGTTIQVVRQFLAETTTTV